MKYTTFPWIRISTSRDLLNLDWAYDCCLEYWIPAQTASMARIASKVKEGTHMCPYAGMV